jgi:hypothetical protein
MNYKQAYEKAKELIGLLKHKPYEKEAKRIWHLCIEDIESKLSALESQETNQPDGEKKVTAKQFIIDNYGENWLHVEWSAGDVMDAMDDFSESKEPSLVSNNERLLLLCFAEYWNHTFDKDTVSHIYSRAIDNFIGLHPEKRKWLVVKAMRDNKIPSQKEK